MKNSLNSIAKLAALTALSWTTVATSLAATIPAGVVLHPTQTLIRNNGSEPETLDPALAESVGANNITRDLFEGVQALTVWVQQCQVWPKAGRKPPLQPGSSSYALRPSGQTAMQ